MVLRMDYRLLLRNGNVIARKAHSRSKRKIVNLIRVIPWTEADVTVVYHNDAALVGENRGTYRTQHDLGRALAAFTEADVVL